MCAIWIYPLAMCSYKVYLVLQYVTVIINQGLANSVDDLHSNESTHDVTEVANLFKKEENRKDLKSTFKGRYYCNVGNGNIEPNSSRRAKRYVLQGRKWKKLDLTWAVITHSRKESVRSLVVSQFARALEVWSNSSKLTFRMVSSESKDVDIAVGFYLDAHGDNYPFDKEGTILAHAFYPEGGLAGDVHFNDAEDFVSHSDVKEGASLFIVAAHELGHSLGLRHSNDDNSLMAPFYKTFDSNFDLPHDDKMAIQSLYGRPHSSPSFRPRPTTSTPKLTQLLTQASGTTTRPVTQTYQPVSTLGVCDLTPEGVPQGTAAESDMCAGDFDDVVHLGSEFFFFRDEHVWRINFKGGVQKLKINSMFYELQTFNLSRIDAAYTLENEQGIVLISGNRVFTVKRNKTASVSTLQDLGINSSRIEAAWKWGHNGHVYFLSGGLYWRLGPDGRAQDDYPRDSAVWQSLPNKISAALTYKGITYFFSKKVFWSFNNLLMRASEPPMEISSYWLGCPYPDPSVRHHCSGQLYPTRKSPIAIAVILFILYCIQ